MGRKLTYEGDGNTKTIRVPANRVEEVKFYLSITPAGVDNPLEYLKRKAEEVEKILDIIKSK